jgi:hypothetical protein
VSFKVLETYATGSRLIELGCGHQIVCGRRVTDTYLNELRCCQCMDKIAHDAGRCVGVEDCEYCWAQEQLDGLSVPDWQQGILAEVRRVYPDFGKDKK